MALRLYRCQRLATSALQSRASLRLVRWRSTKPDAKQAVESVAASDAVAKVDQAEPPALPEERGEGAVARKSLQAMVEKQATPRADEMTGEDKRLEPRIIALLALLLAAAVSAVSVLRQVVDPNGPPLLGYEVVEDMNRKDAYSVDMSEDEQRQLRSFHKRMHAKTFGSDKAPPTT